MAEWRNLTSVDHVLEFYQSFMNKADTRVNDMFLMSSPIPVMLICGVYIYFVVSLGPRLMMDRKPFGLKRIIAIYNVFQVIFNAWLFAASVHMWCKYYGWGLACLPVLPEEAIPEKDWAARLCHLYFINKVIDLMDTLFFVLKKKQDKISILHVFHHAIMPLSIWFGVKFHPGGNLTFFALPNLFVHIWMYLYYLLANMGPEYQKYIWWKRHLTQMQLLQFAMIGLYMGYVSHLCEINRILLMWLFFLDTVFIGLFVNFYVKSYRKRKNRNDNEAKKLEGKVQ